MSERAHAAEAGVLVLLTTAFAGRVLAQLVQTVAATPALPPAAAWQGSSLPYPVLLVVQVVILLAMCGAVVQRARGRSVVPTSWARPLLLLGLLYFAVMALRLVGGLTVFADIAWFAKPLPAVFHLVLASFLILLARGTAFAAVVRAVSYPATMVLAFALYAALTARGLPVATAATATAAAAAIVVTLHELWLPYRPAWRPTARAIANDAAFMVLVQMLLPRLLSFLIVIGIAGVVAERGWGVVALWPHEWPAAGQAALMIVAADFLRYWLHRTAHTYGVLWRFHAVHHSPQQLYWLNVGRFHPLEKVVQFILDTAPFLALGVAPDVLSLYFVFFAVNGFYQHSNCDVRLGPLNHLVSGPELHRWHHSELVEESNHNYGNNLIVWDALFGTRFLPRDRGVGALGLVNRTYPMDFVAQLRGPFVGGLHDQASP